MLTRFSAKAFANGLFALIAIAILLSFASDRRDATLNAIRDFWVGVYMESLKDEAKVALALERKTGDPAPLIHLLESPPWESCASEIATETGTSLIGYRLLCYLFPSICLA